MENAPQPFDRRLAARIRDLRARRGLTLDQLAQHSGVSRSMISLVERAESSPTASVLDRLAASLGVTLASLFAQQERIDAPPVSGRDSQPTWTDPETGYLRRNLSPPGFPSRIELVEVELPGGTRVAYDTGARAAAVDQQIWVLSGAVEVSVGTTVHHLREGDCLAMRLDAPTAFRNRDDTPARYLVALTTNPGTPLSMHTERKTLR